MLPNKNYLTINDNLSKVEKFLREIIITPKHQLKSWSIITNQTPAAKIGYVGQHLASLITGVKGTGSGARGDDLADGTEVKSCNKVDQADKCNNCGARVLRFEDICQNCGSSNITRKDDSKWLFTIRSQEELNQYLNLERILLILMDYPHFNENNFKDIRITTFEIYPKDKRMNVFNELIKNHYYNIYRPKADRGDKTNPMNLHPWSFQFYKCNPIKTFECVIKDIDSDNACIFIDPINYVSPEKERNAHIQTLPMPTSLLKGKEWEALTKVVPVQTLTKQMITPMTIKNFEHLSLQEKRACLPTIDEQTRNMIPLRDIISTTQKSTYQRHKN